MLWLTARSSAVNHLALGQNMKYLYIFKEKGGIMKWAQRLEQVHAGPEFLSNLNTTGAAKSSNVALWYGWRCFPVNSLEED